MDDGTFIVAGFKLIYNDALVRLSVVDEIVEIFLERIGLVLYIIP